MSPAFTFSCNLTLTANKLFSCFCVAAKSCSDVFGSLIFPRTFPSLTPRSIAIIRPPIIAPKPTWKLLIANKADLEAVEIAVKLAAKVRFLIDPIVVAALFANVAVVAVPNCAAIAALIMPVDKRMAFNLLTAITSADTLAAIRIDVVTAPPVASLNSRMPLIIEVISLINSLAAGARSLPKEAAKFTTSVVINLKEFSRLTTARLNS